LFLTQSTFEYVGIGIRFVAVLIDSFIAVLILGLLMSVAGYDISTTTGFGLNLVSAAMIGGFFLYFVLMEGFFGTTVGKMIFRVRIVKEDGRPCGLGAAVVRNLLRFIDGLPALYLIGAILIMRSNNKQRLGDRVAKTVVVKLRRGFPSFPPPPPTYPPPTQTPNPIPPPYPPPPAPQSMKYCMNCGAPILAQALFCPKCGGRQ